MIHIPPVPNYHNMANTYTQIHIHFVFVVKYRKSLIQPTWKSLLHAYITGIVQNNNHKMLIINSMPDHIHMLVGFRPDQSVSQLMSIVKGKSSDWINHQNLSEHIFHWQSGYAGFSYAKSDLKRVIRYIENQEEHHRRKSFNEEILLLLEEFGIPYDEKYILKSPE